MLSAGKNITSANDRLLQVTPDYLYRSIKNPKPEISSKIRQLRIIRTLDTKRYSICKRELPYFVCASFNPPYRKTENYVSTDCFVVDLDHISESNYPKDELRRKLEADPRVMMLFLSPGEDGFKIMFRLKEKCCDSTMYTIFYKRFLDKFSEQYNLADIIDRKTSDVCRACFISEDQDAYFNPDAETIDFSVFVNTEDSVSLSHTLRDIRHDNITIQESHCGNGKPDDDDFAKIREILKLRKASVKKPPVYVPEQLNNVMEGLNAYIESSGITIQEIRSISYGKKLSLLLAGKSAEINIFYGKHGYSVVKSPRCGTNKELNDIAAELISAYLNQM